MTTLGDLLVTLRLMGFYRIDNGLRTPVDPAVDVVRHPLIMDAVVADRFEINLVWDESTMKGSMYVIDFLARELARHTNGENDALRVMHQLATDGYEATRDAVSQVFVLVSEQAAAEKSAINELCDLEDTLYNLETGDEYEPH